MLKCEIKKGMVFTTRRGDKFLFMEYDHKEIFISMDTKIYFPVSEFQDNLTHSKNKQLDIMSISLLNGESWTRKENTCNV